MRPVAHPGQQPPWPLAAQVGDLSRVAGGAGEAPGKGVEAFAPAAGEVAASEWAPDPAGDSVDGSSLEDEERFEEMFESMRLSLDLEQERWAEVEWELVGVLESLWPEYVALSKTQDPDTAGLRRRYCARMEAVLAPEEAARLGCGGPGTVTDLVQPPAAATTP